MDAFRLLGIAECHHLSSSVLLLARQIWWTDGPLQQWRADCSPALQSTDCVHHVTAVIHQNRGKKYHLFLQPLLHLSGLSIHYIYGLFPSLFYNSTNRIFLQCYRSVNKLISLLRQILYHLHNRIILIEIINTCSFKSTCICTQIYNLVYCAIKTAFCMSLDLFVVLCLFQAISFISRHCLSFWGSVGHILLSWF